MCNNCRADILHLCPQLTYIGTSKLGMMGYYQLYTHLLAIFSWPHPFVHNVVFLLIIRESHTMNPDHIHFPFLLDSPYHPVPSSHPTLPHPQNPLGPISIVHILTRA